MKSNELLQITQISPKNGFVNYIGDIDKDGKKHGFGTLYCLKTGFCIYKGKFVEDLYEDINGELYDIDTGMVIYKGSFVKGQQEGEGFLLKKEESDRNFVIWSEYFGLFSQNQIYLQFPTENQINWYYNKGSLKFEGFYDQHGNKTSLCRTFHYNGYVENEGQYQNDLEEDEVFSIRQQNGYQLYMGGMKEGLYHGYGELFGRRERLEFKGWFKDGKPDGEKVTQFNSKGKKEYVGSMINGVKEGYGEQYHFNGKLKYKGNFKDNGPDQDNAFQYSDNGKLNYNGDMKSGKKHGKGKFYNIRGLLMYSGGWKLDKKDGWGTDYNPDGSQRCYGYYVKNYQSGLRKAKFYYIGCDLLEYEGPFINGKKEGLGREYYKNGKLKCMGVYTNGLLDFNATKGVNIRIFDDRGNIIFDGQRVARLKMNSSVDSILADELIKFGILNEAKENEMARLQDKKGEAMANVVRDQQTMRKQTTHEDKDNDDEKSYFLNQAANSEKQKQQHEKQLKLEHEAAHQKSCMNANTNVINKISEDTDQPEPQAPTNPTPAPSLKTFRVDDQKSELEYYKGLNKETKQDIQELKDIILESEVPSKKDDKPDEAGNLDDDDADDKQAQMNPLVKRGISTIWIQKLLNSKVDKSEGCVKGTGILKGNFEDDSAKNYQSLEGEEQVQLKDMIGERFYTIEGQIINSNIQGYATQKFKMQDRRDWPQLMIMIQGQFVNNLKSGFCEVVADGQLIYKGQFRNDVVYGRGLAYYHKKANHCPSNGVMSIGEHRRDKRYSYYHFDEKKVSSCKAGRVYAPNGKMIKDGHLDVDYVGTNKSLLVFNVLYYSNGQIFSIGDALYFKHGRRNLNDDEG